MKFGRVFDNRFSAVVAGAAVLALLGAGAGYAVVEGHIGTNDVIDDSLKSVDIKNHSLQKHDLSRKAIKKLKGAGSQGPQGPQGPAGNGDVTVSQLGASLPFDNTNPTVSLTPDGVEFGPYSGNGGSICTKVLNGKKLADVKNLAYNVRFRSTGNVGDPAGDGDSGLAAPYLRIYLTTNGSDEHHVIFSPNTQSPDPDLDEGEFNEYVVTSGNVRYDDDAGNGPDSPFAAIQGAHANDTIQGDICITQGFTGARDADALLRWMEINGTRYVFRS